MVPSYFVVVKGDRSKVIEKRCILHFAKKFHDVKRTITNYNFLPFSYATKAGKRTRTLRFPIISIFICSSKTSAVTTITTAEEKSSIRVFGPGFLSVFPSLCSNRYLERWHRPLPTGRKKIYGSYTPLFLPTYRQASRSPGKWLRTRIPSLHFTDSAPR